jgi:uncharacterized protein YifN (PemK superfamily)
MDGVITPDLEALVTSQKELKVIVELTARTNKDDSAEGIKAQFEIAKAPLEETILSLGGKVHQTAWINQSLMISIPAERIRELASTEGVRQIALPKKIQAEV